MNIETCIKKSQFSLFISFYAFKNILCSGIEIFYIKTFSYSFGKFFVDIFVFICMETQ